MNKNQFVVSAAKNCRNATAANVMDQSVVHGAGYFSFTAKAAALYHDAAAIAPGSGTDASISPET